MSVKKIYPTLPSGHSIFCDDVRHEISGKKTIVGIYSTHLFVSEIPSVLPKLCICITFRDDIFIDDNVTFRVFFERIGDDETIDLETITLEDDLTNSELLIEIEVETPSEVVRPAQEAFVMREGKFEFQISPFNITSRGKLKVRAYRGDLEILLGTLIIENSSEESQQHAR